MPCRAPGKWHARIFYSNEADVVMEFSCGRNLALTAEMQNRVMNTGDLQIERRTLGEISILDCTGRIVVRRETDFLFEAAAFAIERSRSLVLNFSLVTSIDSGGLGTIVLLKKHADTFSCDIAICEANPRVSEILSLTGLHRVLPLYRTEDDALRATVEAMGKAPSARRAPLRTAPGCSAA